MKKLLFILLFASATPLSKAQGNFSDKQAIQMLERFYPAYMGVFVNATPSTDVEAQLNILKQNFCTKELLNRLPGLTEQSDADPLIKAQDSNADCVKNLSFTKSPKKHNLYIVSYYYVDTYSKEKETTIIYVTVVNKNGLIRIDNVQ